LKTIAITEFGGREQLQFLELPTPKPEANEVLIRVTAAGINPVDWKIREGYLRDRLPYQFPIILGWDAAGVVERVGTAVHDFEVGDRVMTYARKPTVQWGTYAEYVSVPVGQVASVPRGLSLEEASVLPLAGLTAYQALFDAVKLHEGQTILIHAGGGGVGGYAVQLAKLAGATVITTASAGKHSFVKELGADWIIDYQKSDFVAAVRERYPDGIDAVFDTIGGKIQQRSTEVVSRGGHLVSILALEDKAKMESLGIEPHYVFVSPNAHQLMRLGELAGKEELLVPLVEVYPMEEIVKAHELIESGHMCGKIALQIENA